MNCPCPLNPSSVRDAHNLVAATLVAGYRRRCRAALLSGPLALLPVVVCAAPTGGEIKAGSGQITQNGNTTTIQQGSDRLAINWQSFNVAVTESVHFNQPGRSSIVLNRVLGQSRSAIHGKITANGQVFILNPNGVLFSSTSQVNVGGLVASTLHLSDTDFMNGRYVFSGSGRAGARIINQGSITVDDGGYIALLAPQVANHGKLTANGGNVTLAAGTQMTLTLQEHSLVTLSIEQGAVDALVENHDLIQADGGVVVLSSKGKDAALSGVVNNTGVIQARTVSNKKGEIRLLAEGGTVKLGGLLDASAGDGGDGGTIATTGDKVDIADSAQITTAAPNGQTGHWQIKSNDFTIARKGGNVSGSTMSRLLESNNVGISTQTGDIDVNDALGWNSATRLSLTSQQDIRLNDSIDAPHGDLALKAGKEISASGAVRVRQFALNGGKWEQNSAALAAFHAHDFRLNAGSFLRVGGGDGSRGNPYKITDVYGLQGIGSSRQLLSGSYRLINHIDASGTANWHDGAGFVPLGDGYDNAKWGNGTGYARSGESHGAFTGDFDGDGYMVSDIHIHRPRQISVGMVGFVDGGGTVRNVHLKRGSIVGGAEVGALVGSLWDGTVSNSISSATVTGSGEASKLGNLNDAIGGLVGGNFQRGTISQSHASGAVRGEGGVGGLVGMNDGKIEHSYASGTVDGQRNVGGLTGVLVGQVQHSYATGAVTGKTNVGGLVGISRKSEKRPEANENGRQIRHSYATGAVTGETNVGGLVGNIEGGAQISNSYATGVVNGRTKTGGLVGNIGPDGAAITASHWDKQTTGQRGSAGGEGRTTPQMQEVVFTLPQAGALPPAPPAAPQPFDNRPPPVSIDTAPPVDTGIMHTINAVRTARLAAPNGTVPPAGSGNVMMPNAGGRRANIAELITITEAAPELALEESLRSCAGSQGVRPRACGEAGS